MHVGQEREKVITWKSDKALLCLPCSASLRADSLGTILSNQLISSLFLVWILRADGEMVGDSHLLLLASIVPHREEVLKHVPTEQIAS